MRMAREVTSGRPLRAVARGVRGADLAALVGKRYRMRITPLITLIAVAGIAAGSANAAEKAGVKLPDQVQVAGKQLALNGMGLRVATILKVHVYVAGLYLEQPSSDANAIVTSDEMKVMILHFVRHVGRDDIIKAWHEGFANSAIVPAVKIQSQIAQLDSWTTGFSDGDNLTFTYVPGAGVAVDLNGARKGVIEGKDFAHALFAIWLGPHARMADLKAGLLGKH